MGGRLQFKLTPNFFFLMFRKHTFLNAHKVGQNEFFKRLSENALKRQNKESLGESNIACIGCSLEL